MGVDSRRLPLPAPTDISSSAIGNTSDDLATDISRRTDRTSYSIPEDGSPVTISTKKIRDQKDLSQTSLLIEYFEASKSGAGVHSRPSVRVRVTPSGSKKSRAGDHIQITETGKNRKPSYTRRISLPKSSDEPLIPGEYSDVSSDRPPVEVEVLQNLSDLSQRDQSPTRFMVPGSDISSMPPSIIGSRLAIRDPREHQRDLSTTEERRETVITDTLKEPERRRSLSRERLVQKAMQKVQAGQSTSREMNGKQKSSSRRSSRSESSNQYVVDEAVRSPQSRSTKYHDDDHLGSMVQPSEISALSDRSVGQVSVRSGVSGASSINNPKLLSAVEDAIKRLILPELNAVKEEQARQKNRMKFEDITKDSMAPAGSRENLRERRVSKSSSSPNVSGRPAIVTDDRGIVVSSDSVRGKKSRQSSRGSEKSHDTVIREESSQRKSSREKRHSEKAAGAAALVGAGLTYAALKHHDSMSSLDRDHERERRKKRTKSKTRSRATSMSESVEELPRKGARGIPPIPTMESHVGTDLTRDSIRSADAETDRPLSVSSREQHTPVREIREVSRGSPRHVISPEPTTPTRTRTPTSANRGLGTYHENHADFSPVSARSGKSRRSISENAKLAGLAAVAGLGGAGLMAAERAHHDSNRELTPTRDMSPAQSAGGYQEDAEEVVEHERIRSIKSGGSLSGGRKSHKKRSNLSIDSMSSSPTTNLASSKKRPEGVSLERGYEILPENKLRATTPQSQSRDVDQWLEDKHAENERYRQELETESQLGSSLVDHRRDTQFTDDSMLYEDRDKALLEGQNYHSVGANPEYVRTPVAVESAVASLHEPSLISVQSSQKSGSIRDDAGFTTGSRGINTGSAAYQLPSSSRERWETIRDQAIANVRQTAGTVSPRQSNASLDHHPVMGASALPMADEPMPEIGHGLDDASDVTTNPSIIQGPIGGPNHEDRSHWPYEPTPHIGNGQMPSQHEEHEEHHGRDAALLGAGAAVGLGLATANARKASQERQSTPRNRDLGASVEQVQDEEWRQRSPHQQQYGYPSPAANKIDEGYMSGAVPGGELTPDPYAAEDRGYDEGEFGDEEDPFTTQKHLRHESGMSHGMASPLYDSATGRGIDRIQSKDVVALMDHLTVRDAQRNARDTEILVTLVRSAAETRNQFDEMKKYIAEQDRMIMQNTDRDADLTVQRVLGGPRPFPSGSPRGTRRQISDDSDDLPNKRKNVFRRALQGLSLKGNNDLSKIEGMLMQLLDEVEELKNIQGAAGSQRATTHSGGNTHSMDLNSYENLRAQPDSGYEPEGQAGTHSSPNNSGHLSVPSSKQLNAMHSGYDGRRGSDGHRISTVLEGDEESEEWKSHSAPNQTNHQYEIEERLLTPSQEAARGRSVPLDTPPEQAAPFKNSRSTEETPRTDKSRKHKSNTSSIFSGFPKISRWSKTTTSSAPDPETARNSTEKKEVRPYSHMSQSGSNLELEYDDDYEVHDDDRLRSQTSFSGRGQPPRSPSPLIPEDRQSLDDPKYQAHRNSVNLQHPQPRPGPTHRHQTYLESQAVSYENPPTPEADHWGNTPALSLNRNRYSGGSGQHDLSPVYDDEDAYSQHSASEQAHNRVPPQQSQGPPRPPKVKSDEGPLVPPKVPLGNGYENSGPTVTTTTAPPPSIGFGYSSPFSNSGMHIASPLEPIEEVRYSLETDGTSIKNGRNNDLTPSPRPTAMQSVQRKITGPREMPPRRDSPGGNLGTVRRKPVTQPTQHSRSPVQSLESYRDSSDESETF